MGYRPWGCKESDTTEQLTHTQEKITVYLELKPCSSVGKESAYNAGRGREDPLEKEMAIHSSILA